MYRSLLLLVAFVAAACSAARTAVFLEEAESAETNNYSAFLGQLSARGHELSYFTEKSADFALKRYGDALYENVVILAPTLKTLGATNLGKDALLTFVEDGGNVIVGGSIRLSKMLRQFALESGVEFEKKGTIVMDHVNHLKDPTDTYHSLIKSTKWISSDLVVGKDVLKNKKPVVYNGIGMTLEPSNILGFTVLSAEPTAYSAAPTKDIRESHEVVIGSNVGLVTAIQARNNARLIFSGSVDLFDNSYVASVEFGNGAFVQAVSKWGLGESGVLKVSNVHHAREDGSLPDKMLSDVQRPDQPLTLYPDAEVARDSLVYRIKDNLTYSFDVAELKNGQWTPFAADDVQLEFVMLDPHVRKTMVHDGKGHFSVTFTAPDVYGIFQFRVMYRRVGYSTLHFTTQVSLRPYKHDEYERFIPAAFPYYASAFSMMAGVLIFSIVFLMTPRNAIFVGYNMHYNIAAITRTMMADDEDDDVKPWTPPVQCPAPQYPNMKKGVSRIPAPSARLDHNFLNLDKALNFAHRATAAPAAPTTPHSTLRLASEIERVQRSYLADDNHELDEAERREILRQAPVADYRYNYDALIDVDAPTPVKPRKVKKQIDDKWKQSLQVAPRLGLPPDIDLHREERVTAKDGCGFESFNVRQCMSSVPLPTAPMRLFLINYDL
ncbi:dolichyl-diphosphooligosaccharide-protein glycosyltransferase 48kD subunit [Achlya hypogyna]|uniref:Dolichyl-diphosphooligosaccharide--protein glycosyltransferase 48 kDa subunit n=1 Tax=Achlya hypogyna TaxID=1202772 RepID=A0A1V9Z4U6_ACHHY|nr:dolichyl-diphosphooligosaccharide-protein glycosyltransferase 48kD subunit [Achlya hypogyna]